MTKEELKSIIIESLDSVRDNTDSELVLPADMQSGYEIISCKARPAHLAFELHLPNKELFIISICKFRKGLILVKGENL
jgi:hypothetical protein